jgi:hypothetical protein
MLTIKNSNHLRTMRHLKSFRSGRTSTGASMWQAELGRIYQEEVALLHRERRRRWLAASWNHRPRGCPPR